MIWTISIYRLACLYLLGGIFWFAQDLAPVASAGLSRDRVHWLSPLSLELAWVREMPSRPHTELMAHITSVSLERFRRDMKPCGQDLERLAATQCLPHFLLTSCESLRIFTSTLSRTGARHRHVSAFGRMINGGKNSLQRRLLGQKAHPPRRAVYMTRIVGQDNEPYLGIRSSKALQLGRLDCPRRVENGDVGRLLHDRSFKLRLVEAIVDNSQALLQAQHVH